MSSRALPPSPRARGLLCLLVAACQGGPDTTPTTDATTGLTTLASSDSDTTAGEPGEPLCAGLDVSLVIDPAVAIDDAASREALARFLDDVTLATRTKVRVLPNVGAEVVYDTGCFADAAPIVVWGEAGVLDPDAPAQLACALDAIDAYPKVSNNGDSLFGGLMRPLLDVDGWPAPGASGLALLLGDADDQPVGFSNAYNRPGMVSEAYIRLVGDGDRRRVEAFTTGRDADRLQTFTVTLGDRGHFFDLEQPGGVAAALELWTPRAIAACEEHDAMAPPLPSSGCKRVDILFVIDGSESMAEEQAALSGDGGMTPVFAEFTDALLAELDDVEDFHVGVVSTEPGVTALHTHSLAPNVPEGPDTDCGLPPGQRWIVGPTPTLAEDFACLAATRSGLQETTAANAAGALVDPANDGFLRDDSLVFVIMLTDEDTYEEVPTRMQTRTTLIDAVGGTFDRLLVLGVAGDQGVYEAPKGECDGVYGAAKPAGRLTSIVGSLREHGMMQDICQGSLAATFADVLETVVSACEIVP